MSKSECMTMKKKNLEGNMWTTNTEYELCGNKNLTISLKVEFSEPRFSEFVNSRKKWNPSYLGYQRNHLNPFKPISIYTTPFPEEHTRLIDIEEIMSFNFDLPIFNKQINSIQLEIHKKVDLWLVEEYEVFVDLQKERYSML